MLFCLCIFYLPRTFSIWRVYFQLNTDIFHLTRIFSMQCRHFLFNANIFNSTRTFPIWRGYFQYEHFLFDVDIFNSTRIVLIQCKNFDKFPILIIRWCFMCAYIIWMCLKVHKIDNFFDSDFGICVISLLVMSKY